MGDGATALHMLRQAFSYWAHTLSRADLSQSRGIAGAKSLVMSLLSLGVRSDFQRLVMLEIGTNCNFRTLLVMTNSMLG